MSFIFKAPPEVLKYILKVQGEKKAEKGISQYSQLQTICHIIMEHKTTREQEDKKVELGK